MQMTNPITTPNEEQQQEWYKRGFQDSQKMLARPQSGLSAGDREKLAEHVWEGCEEVNDWFVATCSCGWTYQHPNYGTSQDTFVNHWADHILSMIPVLSSAPTETEEDRELRALAEKATQGPWHEAGISVRDLHDHDVTVCERHWEWEPGFGKREDAAEIDAAYIAACSPDRIISLLDRLAGKGK
jgi:hypothetical protein